MGKAFLQTQAVPEGQDITKAVSRALLNEKAWLASGDEFGSEEAGWFRIVSSYGDYYLNEGLKRIIKALS